MLRALDKLFEFCASLKLAIILILSIAFYLGAATFYESAYGTPAVQQLIYDSRGFMLLMSFLAINVMAAVVIRYPWKRKQTGFIITHAGIEILLLGCLITHRFAIEGRVSLTEGKAAESMDSVDEVLNVDLPDASGTPRGHVMPIRLWQDCGYPSMLEFAAHGLGTFSEVTMPRWPAGHTVDWQLGANAHLEILDWVQAALPQTSVVPVPDGFPTALIHLGGTMPSGMPVDGEIDLNADPETGNGVKYYNSLIEFVLWKAQSQAEVDEFLHPPDPKSLPDNGRVVLLLKGQRYSVDVTPASIGKATPLGTSGYTATIEKYMLRPDTDEPDSPAASNEDNPSVNLQLDGPEGTEHFQAQAWDPEMLIRLKNGAIDSHGYVGPGDPIIRYYHPAAYFTHKQSVAGRLHLLAGPDGALYARVFKIDDSGHDAPVAPFKVEIGHDYLKTWLGFSFTATQYSPSGKVDAGFRLANIDANQLADHNSAMKVALVVDGQRIETWLERSAGPREFDTPRGPVYLEYTFPPIDLGFDLKVDAFEQRNEPMSTQAAAYQSNVTVAGSNGTDGPHIISMNEPINVNGMVISQASMDMSDDPHFTTLGIRRDPGWWIKYIGCAGIVGGIFTMFYMKAYFQKTPTVQAAGPVVAGRKKTAGKKRPATASA